MARTKFDREIERYVEVFYPELKPEDVPKITQKSTTQEKSEVYALLRLMGATWEKIASLTGQNYKKLLRFRRKHGEVMAKAFEHRGEKIEGVEEFFTALVMLMRAGNVDALKLFALITGRIKHKLEVEGKVGWLDAVRNAAVESERDDQEGD